MHVDNATLMWEAGADSWLRYEDGEGSVRDMSHGSQNEVGVEVGVD